MKLAEWLDEYRGLPIDEVARPAADVDDWQEQPLLAPSDRMHDTTPRWLKRAERVGYGRVTHI
jgi:hypothetical protein